MAGDKYFHNIFPYYITGTQDIVLICDATNLLTLMQLDEYLALINTYLDTTVIPSVLMSTKHDLPVVFKSVDIEEFMCFHSIQNYFPTNAVTGLNIDAVFHYIEQLIAEKQLS